VNDLSLHGIGIKKKIRKTHLLLVSHQQLRPDASEIPTIPSFGKIYLALSPLEVPSAISQGK
jgi:hypothetical protein